MSVDSHNLGGLCWGSSGQAWKLGLLLIYCCSDMMGGALRESPASLHLVNHIHLFGCNCLGVTTFRNTLISPQTTVV